MTQMQSFPTDAAETRMVEPEVEAAGIEPARESPPKEPLSRGFSAAVTAGDHTLRITPQGLYLDGEHVMSPEDAIGKLEFLLKAARLQEAA